MDRITKDSLRARVVKLNTLLNRPSTLWNPGAAAGEQNVGHLQLDKNSQGYKLEEIISPLGGANGWSIRLNAKAMDVYLDGVIRGITLRSIQYVQPNIGAFDV